MAATHNRLQCRARAVSHGKGCNRIFFGPLVGALVFALEGDLVGDSTECTLVGLLVEPFVLDLVRYNTGSCAPSLEEDF